MKKFVMLLVCLGIIGISIVAMEGCSILKSPGEGEYIIPDKETPKEQYAFAYDSSRTAFKGFDKETRIRRANEIAAAFKKVIEKYPEDTEYTPAAYINLGDTYLEIDNYSKAIKYFKKAVEKYPGQEDIQIFGHYGLGVCYDQIGKYEEAKKEYKYCIDKFGDDPRDTFQKIVKKAQFRYDRIRKN